MMTLSKNKKLSKFKIFWFMDRRHPSEHKILPRKRLKISLFFDDVILPYRGLSQTPLWKKTFELYKESPLQNQKFSSIMAELRNLANLCKTSISLISHHIFFFWYRLWPFSLLVFHALSNLPYAWNKAVAKEQTIEVINWNKHS